jgi:hypothetical protein
MAAWLRVFVIFVFVSLVVGAFVTGCGSSGDDISTQPPGYNGLTSQAVITQKSAVEISKTLFVQTQSQESLSSIESIYLGSDLGLPATPPPLLDKLIAESERDADGQLIVTTDRVSTDYTIAGACGGLLTLVTDIDTDIGFSAIEVTYDAFCYEGITLDGGYTLSINVAGDGDYAGTVLVTYSLRTVTEPDGVNRYEGDLEVVWSEDQITRTYNYVVTNLTTGLGVQYDNFVIVMDVTSTETTWTQEGRFYHSLYGYVDVETEEPFVAEPGLELPHEGRLKMTGAAASGGAAFGWFEVFPDGFQVTVDTDGDGSVDGDTELLPWGQMPVP